MNVLLTGATGFLGQYLLLELIRRGHIVWALYRNEEKRAETARFVTGLIEPRNEKSLHWFRGDLLRIHEMWDGLRREHPGLDDVDTVLHSAASVRFRENDLGDPMRTNVGSAKSIKSLVERTGMQAHIVSTAYVCGLVRGEIVREVLHPDPSFLNIYEQSKWEAEQIWDGNATILRPSIIVGDSKSGRCISFTGWYIAVKALHKLDQAFGPGDSSARRSFRIAVPADPDATSNVVPVDYVAEAAIRIVENPSNHNRIFHLTHPDPPTHQWSHEVLGRRFNITGLRLVGSIAEASKPNSEVIRMLRDQTRPVLSYFVNNPIFDRSNVEQALPDLHVPSLDEEMFNKLIAYAIKVNWGKP